MRVEAQVRSAVIDNDEVLESGRRSVMCSEARCNALGIDDSVVLRGEVKGAPSVYQFTSGGALVFNY